jgi:hypothetical protein
MNGGLPMRRLNAFMRWFVLALASTALSGCVYSIDRPTTPRNALTENGPTYAEAVSYIETARGAFDLNLRDLDNLASATKAGVGLGLAGAGAAAAFQTTARPILGFLTLSAASYSANVATDPPTLADILTAGLDNLDCIESAGDKINSSFTGQKYVIALKQAELATLLNTLKSDIANAAGDATATSEVQRANDSMATGLQTLGTMDFYLARSPVAAEMIRATRRTIYAVNKQLRDRAPSINAIAQSGSVLSSFLNTGSEIQASAAAGAGKIQTAAAAHSGSPNVDKLVEDQNQLQAKLAEVSTLLVPVSIVTVTQCQAQFAAVAPLTLLNPVPVDLDAGATLVLRTVSGATGVPHWSGALPTDVTWNVETDGLLLAAQPAAKTASYKLRLADFAGHSSDEFTLNIHAAASPGGAKDGGNGAAAPVPGGPPPSPGGPPPPPGGH